MMNYSSLNFSQKINIVGYHHADNFTVLLHVVKAIQFASISFSFLSFAKVEQASLSHSKYEHNSWAHVVQKSEISYFLSYLHTVLWKSSVTAPTIKKNPFLSSF